MSEEELARAVDELVYRAADTAAAARGRGALPPVRATSRSPAAGALRGAFPAAWSATPGAQDDVGDVRGAGRRVDARLDGVHLDGEVVVEQPAEVVDTDVIRGVDPLGLHVLRCSSSRSW